MKFAPRTHLQYIHSILLDRLVCAFTYHDTTGRRSCTYGRRWIRVKHVITDDKSWMLSEVYLEEVVFPERGGL